jgi:hypothetical protein
MPSHPPRRYAAGTIGQGAALKLDPFRTRDYITDFDEIVRELSARSEATRAMLRMIEISYGPDAPRLLTYFPRKK